MNHVVSHFSGVDRSTGCLISRIPPSTKIYPQLSKSVPIAGFRVSRVVHTDVGALNGGLGSTETQTNLLVPAAGLTSLLGLGLSLRVLEDVRLLLVSALGLDGQLGRHGCGVCRRGSVVELDGRLALRISG